MFLYFYLINMNFRVRNQLFVKSFLNLGVKNSSSQQQSNIVSRNSIFSFQNDTYTLPSTITCITVTMSGGGGAGGNGVIKNGICYGGGGGGAGGACLKKPICISNPKNDKITVKTVVGKGGTALSPDGQLSSISVYVGNKLVFNHVAHGGKRGGNTHVDNKGGKGGACSTNEMFGGYDGKQGSVTLSGIGKANGGRGGNSAFNEGGLGGNQIDTFYLDFEKDYKKIEEQSGGENGSMGSGGGGSVPGLEPTIVGNGGDGFVIIEM
jgi:hypothetical protein